MVYQQNSHLEELEADYRGYTIFRKVEDGVESYTAVAVGKTEPTVLCVTMGLVKKNIDVIVDYDERERKEATK